MYHFNEKKNNIKTENRAAKREKIKINEKMKEKIDTNEINFVKPRTKLSNI